MSVEVEVSMHGAVPVVISSYSNTPVPLSPRHAIVHVVPAEQDDEQDLLWIRTLMGGRRVRW